MHTASAPVFARQLRNLRAWLDKAAGYAEQKKLDPNVLLQQRLAVDMLPFVKQVQIATDHAKGCVARLAGVDVPKFADDETTLQQLQERVERCVAFVESVPADKMVGSEAREIVIPSRGGERKFVGQDYLLAYALPNFWFHVTTTYAILRHVGVDLGKQDFLLGKRAE